MSEMSPVERHWLERGGTLLKMFLVMGWNCDCHAACVRVIASVDHYQNPVIRHAIEETAEASAEKRYGHLTDLTGEWSDYVLPPYIEEGDDEL